MLITEVVSHHIKSAVKSLYDASYRSHNRTCRIVSWATDASVDVVDLETRLS